MSGLLFFLLCLQAFCLLMLLRNKIVHTCRLKAIDEIYNYQQMIIATDIKRHTSAVWELTEAPGYTKMLFMITCWTYKSFYGNLEQRMKELTDAVAV